MIHALINGRGLVSGGTMNLALTWKTPSPKQSAPSLQPLPIDRLMHLSSILGYLLWESTEDDTTEYPRL